MDIIITLEMMVILRMAKQTIKKTSKTKYRKSHTKNKRCNGCGRFIKK